MSSIQIPLIFDVSANGTIFGEDISGDAIKNHIKLKVTPTVAQSTAFINAMKNILYSDISGSPTSDPSGVLFYKNGPAPQNAIGEAIKQFFFGTTGIQHAGSTSSQNFGLAGNGLYGIPYGIRQTQDSSAAIVQADVHSTSFIDGDGTDFYKILLRIAATHLMGHPFSQGFIQENTIKSDLENCDLSGQVGTHFSISSLTDISEVNVNNVGDISTNFSNGAQVNILQTIYEQLLLHNTSDMSGADMNNADINDNMVFAYPQPLVFKAGNTVTFYVRPRLFLKIDISGGIQSMNSAVGNALGISGATINTDQSGSKLDIFKEIFSITSSNADGYFWLAGRNIHGTESHLSNWSTNLSAAGPYMDTSGGAVAMLDAHVWRIDITLQ
jgi:hypothetical protein